MKKNNQKLLNYWNICFSKTITRYEKLCKYGITPINLFDCMSISAAIPPRFWYNTDCIRRIYPLLRCQGKCIISRLRFKPIEFDRFKIGIVNLFPQTQKWNRRMITHPVCDHNKSIIWTVFYFTLINLFPYSFLFVSFFCLPFPALLRWLCPLSSLFRIFK